MASLPTSMTPSPWPRNHGKVITTAAIGSEEEQQGI